MSTLAGRSIAALRSEHDTLASTVRDLTDAQLNGPSGATQWIVADVLSHIGSGAEITLAGLRAGLGETEPPGQDFNQGVWDRWNALAPEAQAAGAVESDAALVGALEAVPEERHDITIKTFLPDPVPLAAFVALRMSETVLHSWDVRVGVDPAATLTEPSAELLAEHLAGSLSFLAGFIGKPAEAPEHAVVEIVGTPYRLVLADQVRLSTDAEPATATFTGSLEAALRLVYGRLRPEHTPAGVEVTGNVTLDQLRAVFPGF